MMLKQTENITPTEIMKIQNKKLYNCLYNMEHQTK